jgi:hypothetical protein
MKKSTLITTATIVGILLVQGAMPVFAVNTIGNGQGLVNQVNRETNQASKAANKQENNLQNIIARSNTLITNRITSLNSLSSRVQNDSRLSASEKSSLTSDIQTTISGLTALKTKIDADTDTTTARSDEKTIITSYYVYAAFEPKMRYLIVLNNLQTTTANLQALVPQLQNLIDTFKSNGDDVTQLQALLSDVSSQLQTINTTITADITKVQNVSTTSSPAEGTFSSVRSDVTQVVKTGLAKIRADFEQMRPLFKQIVSQKTGTPTSSQAATTSPSGTPTTPGVSVSPAPTQ